MVSRASNIGASEDHERTASTPGEHHCASVGTDTPGSWAGEVREFQATTVITRPGVLRLIIHIMLVGALPNKSRLPKNSSVCLINHFANGERLGKRQILERLNPQRV